MRAIWFRFGTELRTRWRAWSTIAMVAGAFCGTIIAVAIGGERTNTVVERSIASKLSADIYMVPAFSENGDLLDFDAISRFPEVSKAVRLPRYGNFDGYELNGFSDITTLKSSSRVLEGRLPDPNRVDEVVVNFLAREQRRVRVGDVIDLHLSAPNGTDQNPVAGPVRAVTVVGVLADLADFVSAATPSVFVTPSFGKSMAGQVGSTELFVFVLKDHALSLPAFRTHISEITGGKPVLFVEAQNDYEQVRRSFHVQAVALWIMAGFLALIVVVVFTQLFARLARLEARDDVVLTSLGMTRSQPLALAALRGLFIGAIGAGISGVVMVLASQLMPFGRPRLAETAPGIYAPPAPLAIGLAVVMLLVVLQNVAPVRFRSTRVAERPARLAGLRSVVPSLPCRVGLQLATEPRRGNSSTPTRSGVAALTVAVVAVVVSLTVATSLAHLLDTPRLYGWSWDAAVQLDNAVPDVGPHLEALQGIAAVGYGNAGGQVSIGGKVSAELVTMVPGSVEPVMLAGRVPSGDEEVVLARKTASAASARIGSTVSIVLQGQDVKREMRVTGITVLPVESDSSTLGEGVFMTDAAFHRFLPQVQPDVAFVRFEPGVDPAYVRTGIAQLVGGESAIRLPSNPGTLVDFGRVRSLPLVLAGLLALLGLAAISHVLVSTVHARRRHLAVLRILGFTSFELRRVVMWYAVWLDGMALLVGVPLALVGGRQLWTAFAHSTGFVAEPITNPLHVAGVAVAVVTLPLTIAWHAGGRASQALPASELRSN